MRTLNPHPLCLCVPPNIGDKRESIRASLIAEPERIVVTLYEGMILDGRTRYEICQQEGLAFVTENFDGDALSAARFVKEQLQPRRDLTATQRAETVERLCETSPEYAEWIGGLRDKASENKKSGSPADEKVDVTAAKARVAGVSRATQAQTHKARTDRAVADKMLAGEVSAKAAANLSLPVDSGAIVEKANDSRTLDGLKNPIPKALEPIFDEVPKFKEILEHISKARSLFKEVYDTPAGNRLRNDIAERDLGNAYRDVSFAMPYAVCPKERRDHNGCDTCKGHGWITKELHKRLTEREGK